VEASILASAPSAYYTLSEPTDSTQANDSSGNRADPLVLTADPTLPVVFGVATGSAVDDLTAAQFAGTQYLAGGGGLVAGGVGNSLEVVFLTSTVSPGGVPLATVTLGTGAVRIGVDATGHLYASGGVGGVVTSSGTVTDGLTHHAAATASTTTVTLYLDGALVGSVGSLNTFATPTFLEVAGPASSVLNSAAFIGTLCHVAVFPSILSAAAIADTAAVALGTYVGETTSARLIRYAGYAGIPSTEITTETGQTTVQHVDTTGQQAVELMRVMETTEGGVLSDHRDGTTTFHNRAHRLTLASSFTLDMAQQMVESDYQPKMDRTRLANDITAQDVSGQFTAHVFDAQSRDTDHGVASATIETASQDDDEPLFQASWTLYKYKQPRCGSRR
jgi:hypothetical protein